MTTTSMNFHTTSTLHWGTLYSNRVRMYLLVSGNVTPLDSLLIKRLWSGEFRFTGGCVSIGQSQDNCFSHETRPGDCPDFIVPNDTTDVGDECGSTV